MQEFSKLGPEVQAKTMATMKAFNEDDAVKDEIMAEEDTAFDEADSGTKDQVLDANEFAAYQQLKYENSVKRNGGSVVPTHDSNAKWYEALNSIQPEVEGVSKADIYKSKGISKMIIGEMMGGK